MLAAVAGDLPEKFTALFPPEQQLEITFLASLAF